MFKLTCMSFQCCSNSIMDGRIDVICMSVEINLRYYNQWKCPVKFEPDLEFMVKACYYYNGPRHECSAYMYITQRAVKVLRLVYCTDVTWTSQIYPALLSPPGIGPHSVQTLRV